MKQDVEDALVACDCAPDADPPTATAEFRFRAGAPIFAGHFPDHPLVPGVFLLETARTAAERLLDRRLVIGEVLDARFTAEVLPDVPVTTTVRVVGDGSRWSCEASVHTPDAKAARMRLVLVAGEP